MADQIIALRDPTAIPNVTGQTAPSPLGTGGRQLGADAAAEQRELLCLLLDKGCEVSGFARRGILMRILELADISAELFEGCSNEDPFLLAGRMYGLGNDESSAAAQAIRADRDMVQ